MPDPEFLLLGDALWLEFVNTAITPPNARDTLPDAGAYLRWCKAVRADPPAAGGDFTEARTFRSHLLPLARALAAGRTATPAAIEAVNLRLRTMEGHEHLLRVGGAWRIRFSPGRSPRALEAVAQSAAQTIANPLALVRLCANPECGLYFLDESPLQARRWCSGRRCGMRGRIERRRAPRTTPLVTEG